MERAGLETLLAYAQKGDTLLVVCLDLLGGSLGELLTTVAAHRTGKAAPPRPEAGLTIATMLIS
jgi:hypothetical protein